MIRALGLIALLAALGCAGCSNKDFDEGAAIGLARVTAIKLNGEQVVLNERQIACGVEKDLWEEPSGERKTAPILPKGQALNFYGDVVVNDGALGSYAQVRGEFTLEPLPPLDIKDPKDGVKLVTGRAGVNVMNTCFGTPLPLMGVKKGQFSPEAPVQMRYLFNGKDWEIDSVFH
jgi:hypothetical protein